MLIERDGVATQGYEDNPNDLFFATEKKTGWVNVYKDYDDTTIIGAVHDTEEEAMSINNDSLTYVDTIKIEWEE